MKFEAFFDGSVKNGRVGEPILKYLKWFYETFNKNFPVFPRKYAENVNRSWFCEKSCAKCKICNFNLIYEWKIL